jgi:hypothetical protein
MINRAVAVSRGEWVWLTDADVLFAPTCIAVVLAHLKGQREERLRFETSKHLYQDRFCGLRLRGEQTSYKSHCLGDDCEHFAPPGLIQVTLHPGFRRGIRLRPARMDLHFR